MKADWPGPDERKVVKDMLEDRGSPHWEKCERVVKQLVRSYAGRMSVEWQNEVTQRAMVSIWRSLHHFRFQCPLTIWMGFVVKSRIKDELYRNTIKKHEVTFGDLQGMSEEGDPVPFDTADPDALEDIIIDFENESEVLRTIWEYAMQSKDPERTLNIIKRVIEDDASFKQVADELDEKAPNIGYLFRVFRRYMQKWLKRRHSRDK